MRARLLNALLKAGLGEGVKVHGPRDPSLRLPNTLSIGIPGLEARVLLERVGGNSDGVRKRPSRLFEGRRSRGATCSRAEAA